MSKELTVSLNQDRLLASLMVLGLFVKAAQKFVAKVESGQARSVETYTDLKNALDAYDKIVETI